ncbi:MAG: hypothetical protein IKC09_02995 [Oscillospiraceae bacterium]|nr:hypothetical protein [Oscillospiraceae bacterium]
MRKAAGFLALFLLAALLWGCSPEAVIPAWECRVVLEESPGFICADHTQIVRRGADATFYLETADGYRILGTDYENATVSPAPTGGTIVTLHQIRYPTVVTLTVEKSDVFLRYHPNDGTNREALEIPLTPSHLRWNTATGIFTRPGHTLTGWNTAPDGSGTAVGLGSRLDPAEGPDLYAQWCPWSDESLFRWEKTPTGIRITGYAGTEDTVCVPGELEGTPVTCIAADAFRGLVCRRVVLPDSLKIIEDLAFRDAVMEELVLFDNIRQIRNPGMTLTTLRLNAAELPVYSATYYDTFQDKYDWLLSVKDKKKIVLFSGSSTRFGYDSKLLREAFPEYEIVNMGVFAYTTAMPQMELILQCMNPGDVLLHMPEFDAAKRQFCTTTDLDEPFFNMMESNYDTLAALDMRHYTNVFPALEAYLSTRDAMDKKSYGLWAGDFDEDGNPVGSPSYNQYGDYIVYRPNAATDQPVYGLPVHYTVSAFPEALFIDPINRMYEKFQVAGVYVYYTYSPRNALALSDDSTPQARAELDAYFREKLQVPIISELEDSLWRGVYLYGTDNHLSTEGVQIHTQRLIPLLRAQMEQDGLLEKE